MVLMDFDDTSSFWLTERCLKNITLGSSPWLAMQSVGTRMVSIQTWNQKIRSLSASYLSLFDAPGCDGNSDCGLCVHIKSYMHSVHIWRYFKLETSWTASNWTTLGINYFEKRFLIYTLRLCGLKLSLLVFFGNLHFFVTDKDNFAKSSTVNHS